MKRALVWAALNADTIIALLLAILVSALDLANVLSNSIVANATVITLAALAFILLHDRKLQGDIRKEIEQLRAAVNTRNPIRRLTGADITMAIADARNKTDQWIFRGSTATYVRAAILPECVTRARRAGKEFRMRLEIIDPTNTEACRNYVRLYRSLAEGPDSPEASWTVKGTQLELYATILAACWWKNKYEYLSIEVALTAIASTFRWEASSHYFILTQRGPRFPAMLIEHGDPYYNLFLSELSASFRQARRLPIESTGHADLSEEPTIEETKALFTKLEVDLPVEFEGADVAEIIGKALHARNPYAD